MSILFWIMMCITAYSLGRVHSYTHVKRLVEKSKKHTETTKEPA